MRPNENKELAGRGAGRTLEPEAELQLHPEEEKLGCLDGWGSRSTDRRRDPGVSGSIQ